MRRDLPLRDRSRRAWPVSSPCSCSTAAAGRKDMAFFDMLGTVRRSHRCDRDRSFFLFLPCDRGGDFLDPLLSFFPPLVLRHLPKARIRQLHEAVGGRDPLLPLRQTRTESLERCSSSRSAVSADQTTREIPSYCRGASVFFFFFSRARFTDTRRSSFSFSAPADSRFSHLCSRPGRVEVQECAPVPFSSVRDRGNGRRFSFFLTSRDGSLVLEFAGKG